VIHKSLSELAVIEEFILISNQPLYPLIHTIAATKIDQCVGNSSLKFEGPFIVIGFTLNVIVNIRHTVTGKTHKAYVEKIKPVERENEVVKV